MAFNVITGLPRSGSTLLCNILNQNPDVYASSTSPLPGILAGMSHQFSNAPEIRAALATDSEGTTERVRHTLRSVAESWYAHREESVIFDKSRAWATNALLLKDLFPDAYIVVTVRDLRSVFGSIEKQHRRAPVLDTANFAVEKTMYTRADQMFSPDGLIGGPILGIEDLVRRQPKGLVVVQYEALTQHPENTLELLYQKLGLPAFTHDFDNVENVAEDLDALYLDKFPHEGSGKVTPVENNDWQPYVSADLAPVIMNRFPFFNRTFGYTSA